VKFIKPYSTIIFFSHDEKDVENFFEHLKLFKKLSNNKIILNFTGFRISTIILEEKFKFGVLNLAKRFNTTVESKQTF